MTEQEALAYVTIKQQGTALTPWDVESLLLDVKGTTFASIVQVTPVKLAAAHKGTEILKVTQANVQLFGTLGEFVNAYELAVKRSAAKFVHGVGHSNTLDSIEAFKAQGNYFEHTECYSIVKHKTRDEFYLFAIYNRASSQFVLGNAVITREEVARYMTPGAARELLMPSSSYNVTFELDHDVVVRTTKLSNLISIKAMGQTLAV